ncbi:hypothetical protein [Tahibacter amnicola]|uniref:Secreted protein n=1 Tax=Tahibacter amnicola TaxID=2976241 RepID=A0ABY6BHL7_9GAMM|nr:hypothetical protein [Tahibacter amnicola]UXI69279.1 hypothetical protein N4264_06420 [Tahibacter amnicola]
MKRREFLIQSGVATAAAVGVLTSTGIVRAAVAQGLPADVNPATPPLTVLRLVRPDHTEGVLDPRQCTWQAVAAVADPTGAMAPRTVTLLGVQRSQDSQLARVQIDAVFRGPDGRAHPYFAYAYCADACGDRSKPVRFHDESGNLRELTLRSTYHSADGNTATLLTADLPPGQYVSILPRSRTPVSAGELVFSGDPMRPLARRNATALNLDYIIFDVHGAA